MWKKTEYTEYESTNGFLTISLKSPSFGDKVTASSSVPKLCSGYCGSFRSRVTSSVLHKHKESGQKKTVVQI